MDFIPTAEKLLGVLGCGPGAACSCCLQATPWPLESWILPSELLLRSELLTCAAVVLPFCLRSVGQCVSLQSSGYHVTSPFQGALLPDLSPCLLIVLVVVGWLAHMIPSWCLLGWHPSLVPRSCLTVTQRDGSDWASLKVGLSGLVSVNSISSSRLLCSWTCSSSRVQLLEMPIMLADLLSMSYCNLLGVVASQVSTY